MNKRILSLLLVFAMCFSMLPVQALAAEDGGVDSPSENEAVTTEADESTTPTTDVVEEEEEAEEQPAFDFDTASDEEVKAYLSNLDDEAYAAFVESMTDEQFDRLAEIFASDYGTNVNAEEGEEEPSAQKYPFRSTASATGAVEFGGKYYYKTFKSALEAAKNTNGFVIELRRDYDCYNNEETSISNFEGELTICSAGNTAYTIKRGEYDQKILSIVSSQATVTLKNINLHHTHNACNVITIIGGSVLNLDHVKIQGGYRSVYVEKGTLNIWDGTVITGAHNRGIEMSSATVNMYGGEISGCSNSSAGSAIYVSGTLNMSGGTIKGNTANTGVIFVNSLVDSKVNISGGRIEDNNGYAIECNTGRDCKSKLNISNVVFSNNKVDIYDDGGTGYKKMVLGDLSASGTIKYYSYHKDAAPAFATAAEDYSANIIRYGSVGNTIQYDYCVENVDGVLNWVQRNTATIGYTKFASLAVAASVAENGSAIVLKADSSENFTLPVGVTFDASGAAYTGNVSAPEGCKLDFDSENGVYTCVEKPVVAKIGETEYETLTEAVSEAKSGETVMLMADCAENITLPIGVTFNTNDKSYTGAVTAAAGGKLSPNGENGVYTCVEEPEPSAQAYPFRSDASGGKEYKGMYYYTSFANAMDAVNNTAPSEAVIEMRTNSSYVSKVRLSKPVNLTIRSADDGTGSRYTLNRGSNPVLQIDAGLLTTVVLENICIKAANKALDCAVLLQRGNTLYLKNVLISGGQNGVYATDQATVYMQQDTVIKNCYSRGVSIVNQSSLYMESGEISSCGSGDSNGGCAVYLNSGRNSFFMSGGSIVGNTAGGTDRGVIQVDGGTVNIQITGGRIENNTGNAIRLSSQKGTTNRLNVTSAVFANNTKNDIYVSGYYGDQAITLGDLSSSAKIKYYSEDSQGFAKAAEDYSAIILKCDRSGNPKYNTNVTMNENRTLLWGTKDTATIGSTDFAFLAVAASVAQTDDIIVLKADSSENFTLPVGVTFNTNGKNYNGNVSAPEGYRAVNTDGVYNVEKIPVVAAIGGTEYETLAEAVKAAKSGDTIVLMSDCGEDITLPVGVTFDVKSASYTGNVSVPEGCKFDCNGEDGVYYVVAIPVAAMMGNEKYETFAEAFEAAQDGDTVVATGYDDSWNGFPLPSYTIKEGVTFKTNGFDFYANELVINGTLKNECVEDEDGANNESILRVNSIVVNGRLVNNGIVDTSSLTVAANGTYENNGTGMMTDTAVVEGSFVNQEKSILGTADGNNTIVTIKGNGTLTNFADDVFFATVQDEKGNALTPDENGVYKLTAPAVAKIGDTGYETLADAFEAAQTGDTIQIVQAGTYEVPSKFENITIAAQTDGVVAIVKDLEYGQSAGTLKNVVFEGITFDFSGNLYNGFQHSEKITFKNCTFSGLFNSYGEMLFENCEFNAGTSKDYVMWLYAGDVTFKGCTFNVNGKVFNVYNEGNALKDAEGNIIPWKVVVEDCTFNSTKSNKAALNIKETCGAKLLAYDVTVTNCTTNENFPAASGSESSKLLVISPLVQVDDRTEASIANSAAGTGCKVTLDGVQVYPAAATKPVTIVVPEVDEDKGITNDVIAAVSNNTAVSSFTETGLAAALPDKYAEEEVTIKTELKTVAAETKVMTFEVAPYAGEEKVADEVNGEVTFRLPLTNDFTKMAKVVHAGDDDRYLNVEGEEGARYIELTVTHFSEFEVTPVEHAPVAKIGETEYASLAEALNALGKKEGEIVLFGVDTSNTKLTIPKTTTLTIADGGCYHGQLSVNGTLNIEDGGEVNFVNSTSTAQSAINLGSTATMNMNGGRVTALTAEGTALTRGIQIGNTGAVLNVNGGTLVAYDYPVLAMSGAAGTTNIHLNGGTFISRKGTSTSSTVISGWAENFLDKEGKAYRVIAFEQGVGTKVTISRLDAVTPAAVAVDTDNRIGYSSIAQAFKKGNNVVLIQDTAENVTVNEGYELTISEGVTLTGAVALKGTLNVYGNIINNTPNEKKQARAVTMSSETAKLNLYSGTITGYDYAVVLGNSYADNASAAVYGGELVTSNGGKTAFSGWNQQFLAEGVYRLASKDDDGNTHWIFGSDAPVAVDNDQNGYATLVAALAASNNVTLLQSIEENVSVKQGKTLNIGNGIKITGDVSVAGEAVVNLDGGIVGKVSVNGTVNMSQSAYIEYTNMNDKTGSAVTISNSGAFTMNGGRVTAVMGSTGDTRGITVNSSDASLTVTGGQVVAASYAVVRMNAAAGATIKVSGGDFISDKQKSVISGWNDSYIPADANCVMFKTSKHWIVRAPLTLTVEGTKNFEVSPSMGKDDKGNNKLGYAEKITVTETSENANGYWLNKTTGFKVSDSTTYTFTAMDDMTLVWVAVDSDAHVATFITGSNQVLGVFADEELTNLPAVPYKSGYTGVWKIEGTDEEATVEAIKAALVNGPVKVMPYYTVEESQEDVKVYQVIANRKYADVITQLSNDQFAYGSYVKFHVSDSVTAKDTEYVFSHWSADENGSSVVSKDPDFNLKVLKDITLYAIYVENNQDVITIRKPIQTITCSAIEKNVNGVNKHIFTATSKRVLPEGADVAEAGIQYSRDGITWYKDEYTMGRNGHTLNVTTSVNTSTVYFRDYVMLRETEIDEDGEEVTILVTYYSDVLSATVKEDGQ